MFITKKFSELKYSKTCYKSHINIFGKRLYKAEALDILVYIVYGPWLQEVHQKWRTVAEKQFRKYFFLG